MKKMRKFTICIASGLAFVSMLGGVFFGAQHTSGAKAENATETQTASSLWETVNGISLENNVDVPDYMKYGKYATVYKDTSTVKEILTDDKQNLADWELNGLKMVSGTDNQSISFKNTLDINGFSANDEFLTFAPIPSTRGAMDYEGMEIMIQDADDESNYIKVSLSNYILWTAGTKVLAETQHTSALGHNIYMSAFKGLTQDAKDSNATVVGDDVRHRAMKLRYDAAANTVYVVTSAGELDTIAELSNEYRVGYGNAWKGFKNNRVKITITMRNFAAQEAQLMILNVCGQGMNGATLNDTMAPKFSFEKDASLTPKAQLGKKYPLYKAQALDVVSGETPYTCTVVSPSNKNVEIVDGGFIPTEKGYYTLTYTSTDAAGNTATETFKVLAANALAPITIEAAAASGNFSVGENIPVFEATAAGGSGTLNVTTEVVRVGGGEHVIVKEGMFKPMLGGTYCVVYTATDYLGNKATKTITYEVARTQTVVVESITELKRLYEGSQVRFPKPMAYDYVTSVGNKLNAKYEVSVYDKQGVKEVLPNDTFTPDSEKYGDTVKVEYLIYANNDTAKANAVTYTYNVELYAKENDARKTGQIEDYFVFDKNVFTTSYNPDNNSEFLKFYTNKAATAQSVSFANPLLANGFYMSFVLPAGEQNYSSLTISLRDSINSQIGFDLELIDMTTGSAKDKMTYVRTGGVSYAMNGTGNKFDATTGKEIASPTPLTLTYKDGKVLDFNRHTVCTPTVGFDGRAFNGFPSDKAYVTFTFNEVKGASSLLISQLCTQMLYVEYTDRGERIPFEDTSEPTIALTSDLRNDYVLNDVVTVPAAVGFDVITQNVDVYVTVKKPNGSLLFDRVPATEDLSFVLDSQGKYTVTYEAEDAENGTRKSYTIRAKDVTAPTLAVSATELQGKVGKAVSLPTAVLLDDMDQNPRLSIMIITPQATIIALGERTAENAIDSYTFTKRGKYYIRYCVFDNAYNMSFTDIPVVIS